MIKHDDLDAPCDAPIAENYRPEPGIEPRASRLMYERSTTELSRSYTFLLFKFGVLSNYHIVSYLVCGVRAW